jgi:uroporphyrinogen-III synthase
MGAVADTGQASRGAATKLVLVNRPEPAASRTAEALAARGLAAIVAPLFVLSFTDAPAPPGPFDALIVTSANGAEGLSPATVPLEPDAMVFAVGERTASVLTAAGFADVRSADGDQRDLARLVIAALPAGRKLLYAAGEEHKPGLPASLIKATHAVALWVRYRAEAAASLPAPAQDALAAGAVSHVLHYSRRGAETFAALTQAAGLAEAAAACIHLCLSEDTAEPLRQAGSARVEIAASPDEASLLALLDDAPTVAEPPPAQTETTRAAPMTTTPIEAAEPATAVAGTVGATAASSTVRQEPGRPRSGGALSGGLAGLLAGLAAAALALWQGPGLMASLGLARPAADPVAPIAARVATLETALAATRQPPQPIRPQIDEAIRAALAEPGRATQQLRTDLSALQAELAQLAARPAGAAGSAGPDPVQAVAPRLDALQRSLEASQQALAARIAAIEPKLQAVERSTAATAAPGKAQAAARLVISDRLVRALDGGKPFANEARALSALGAPQAAAVALARLADGSAPSRDALLAAFRQARPKMLVDAPGGPDPSLSERLLKLTDGLVRVRATGSIGGVSPAALTARIDQALQRGEAAAARAAWAELPEPARRETAAFEALLSRRGEADAALRTVQDEAVAALAAP